MNIFLKIGISLICQAERADENSLQDNSEQEAQSISTIDEENDLEKWGTRQGVIEVAQNLNGSDKSDFDRWKTKEGVIEVAGRERIKRISPLEKWGTRECIIEVATEKAKERDHLKKILKLRKLQFNAEAARNKKLRKNEIIQITITNNSNKEREITLWGTAIPVSPSLAEDIESHQRVLETTVGVHPQGMVVNPFNSLIYVANQLSDSVSILRIDGVLVGTVELPQAGYPGTYSPTHLAVHSKIGSPQYGKVYVVGSVANSVSVINSSLQRTAVIAVGIRPMAIAFNPVNERIYVANMVSNTISVINPATDEVAETVPTLAGPWQLNVNPSNGDIYILYRNTSIVQVWNINHVLVFQTALISEPISLTWSIETNRAYVVSSSNDQVIPINTDTYDLLPAIPVGNRPYGIAFHPGNKFIYVANTLDGTISIIGADHTIRGTIPANGINAGLVVHPTNNVLWTRPASKRVEMTGYATETSAIQADHNELLRLLNHFRGNPAILQHIKFSVSGSLSVKNFTIRQTTISGKKTDTAIPLSSYESPQHFQRVYEIDEVKGTMLDGNSRWRFAIPPLQSVTILVYYHPLDREAFFKKSLSNVEKTNKC
jgi:YVTN family beta-propeller protein